MARLIHWLFSLASIPLAVCLLSKFDLHGSESRLRTESSPVLKTIPISALPSELDKIRLRRNHDGEPTSNSVPLNDPNNAALIHYSGSDQKVSLNQLCPCSCLRLNRDNHHGEYVIDCSLSSSSDTRDSTYRVYFISLLDLPVCIYFFVRLMIEMD